MIEDELTKKIIGCAMDVHRELGAGYLEKVYENALMHALRNAGLNAVQQVPIKARYRGETVGDFIADIVVEQSVILELKACSQLNVIHEVQLVSYLKATGISTGLLFNFGAPSLQFKRKCKILLPPASIP